MPNNDAINSPENLVDVLPQALRAINAQLAADVAFDLVKLGHQQNPDFLLDTLDALDADCRSTFMRQICKRIAGECK